MLEIFESYTNHLSLVVVIITCQLMNEPVNLQYVLGGGGDCNITLIACLICIVIKISSMYACK